MSLPIRPTVAAALFTAGLAFAGSPWGLDLPISWKGVALSNQVYEVKDPRGFLRVEFVRFGKSPWPDREGASRFLKDRFDLSAAGTSETNGSFWLVARGDLRGLRHHIVLRQTAQGALMAIARIRPDAPPVADAGVESLLDSFDPDNTGAKGPGILSRLEPGFTETRPPLEVRFGGELLRADFTAWERRVARLAALREKAVLEGWPGTDDASRLEARARYYRRLYRHLWPALEPFSGSLKGYFAQKQMDAAARAGFLTASVYLIPTDATLAGPLESPLDLVAGSAGRADAKTLLLTILLHQCDLDGEFLLSLAARHAFIGLPRAYLREPQTTFLTRGDGTPLVGIELILVPNTVYRFPTQWAILPLKD